MITMRSLLPEAFTAALTSTPDASRVSAAATSVAAWLEPKRASLSRYPANAVPNAAAIGRRSRAGDASAAAASAGQVRKRNR